MYVILKDDLPRDGGGVGGGDGTGGDTRCSRRVQTSVGATLLDDSLVRVLGSTGGIGDSGNVSRVLTSRHVGKEVSVPESDIGSGWEIGSPGQTTGGEVRTDESDSRSWVKSVLGTMVNLYTEYETNQRLVHRG